MKKLWISLLLACMLFPALAESGPSAKERALPYLTEVYGYTERETEGFVFEDDGKGTLTYYPKDHPEWAYTLRYEEDGQPIASTPFLTDHAGYPGEAALRDTLRAIGEQRLLSAWRDGGRDTLRDLLLRAGISPNAALRAMLYTEEGAPEGGRLIEALFLSCYGDEALWPKAARQWRDEALAALGFTRSLSWAEQPDGIETRSLTESAIGEATLTRFKGVAPADWQAVFDAEARLAGWRCVAGAALIRKEPVQQEGMEVFLWEGMGLAAFEKGDQRLLVALGRDAEEPWRIFSLGTSALYGPPYRLSIDYGNWRHMFQIRFEGEEEAVSFDVMLTPQTMFDHVIGMLCQIERLLVSAGDRTMAITSEGSGSWRITETEGDRRAEQTFQPAFPMMLGLTDASAFPRSMEEALRQPPVTVPEGYAVAHGVHLRQKTSSRSRDLGTLHQGALIRKLGMEPGDPYEWVYAKVGDLTGYVSSIYTSEGESGYSALLYPLMVAETVREVPLKKDTGLFAGTVQTLAAGTRMHVVMDRGDALYVCIPRAGLGWRMDPEGVWGFVPRDAVRLASMAVQLDWMADEGTKGP